MVELVGDKEKGNDIVARCQQWSFLRWDMIKAYFCCEEKKPEDSETLKSVRKELRMDVREFRRWVVGAH